MWAGASASSASAGSSAGNDPRRQGPLLVRIPSWLGDLVLAFPVLEAASRGDALFLGPEPFRDIVAPRFPNARYLGTDRVRRWEPRAAIRAASPRAAVLLTESLSSAILAWSAGVPVRIGYAAEWRAPFLTNVVRRAAPARFVSRSGEYRVIAEAAGLRVTEETPRLEALREETDRAAATLARAGLAGRSYLVIAPGASYGPAKQWGPDRFADVARDGIRKGLVPVLVGSAGDASAADVLRAIASDGSPLLDLIGMTKLDELIGILAGAEAVVSNDSGVMHLAAALRRPTVGIFGSTSPVWTSSSAPWVRNLYAAYPCSPCYRRTCPIGYGCLRAIHPADAVRAVEELLGETGGR